MQFNQPLLLCTQATDMRKSFTGLIALVKICLKDNPGSGQVFVFINKNRRLMKCFYYEPGGYCIWSKRLEQGHFAMLNKNNTATKIALSATEFSALVKGFDIAIKKRRKRYVLADKFLQENTLLQKQNVDLSTQKQLDWFKQQLFGQKSERRLVDIPAEQGRLFGEIKPGKGLDAPTEERLITRKKRQKQRNDAISDSGLRFDESVIVEEIRIEEKAKKPSSGTFFSDDI